MGGEYGERVIHNIRLLLVILSLTGSRVENLVRPISSIGDCKCTTRLNENK